jgi:hypothetical protein
MNAVKNSTRYMNELLLYLNPEDKNHHNIIECIETIEKECKIQPENMENFTSHIMENFYELIKLGQVEISRQLKESKRWI